MLKPYYQDNCGITIYHGDCREILPTLDLQADACIADPPYGETNIEWDRWPNGWVGEIYAALKPTAHLWCFGSMRMFLSQLPEFKGWRFVQEIIWEKHNGSGFNVDRFRRVHELVANFVQTNVSWSDVYKSPQFTNDAVTKVVRKKSKPSHWNGETGATTYTSTDGGPRMMRSVLQVRSMHGIAVHPTEKPIGILTPIIEYACPPRGIVLAPFMGSGSDLIAAKQLGRFAVGIEQNERYCEMAARRLSQGVLFGSAVTS